ncbi:relaxase/mobilization nuclease domain-containing protein [Arcobacter sp. F2176]|uniref:relaxase/mobilization nuclease domain-containing protein n=1 Tax=Arcobacter sp. F2176 TaxID=2044511 RepID=UPI0010277F36|nr:relaxase/mobilization nuclease domain-containing protein [Arcobacter sp. F2176]RXJ82166.1 hypothetical protein CRU95_04575 [Arcobacter sp. F2176]
MSIDLTDEFLNKAKKVKNGKRGSILSSKGKALNSFYYSSVPKEAVFKVIKDDKKIGKGTIKSYTVKKAIQYIGRDKENDLTPGEDKENDLTPGINEENLIYNLETSNGEILTNIQDINKIYNEWQTTFSSKNRTNGKDADHILFSTSEIPGTNDKEIMAAARDTLNKEFRDKGYEYVFALHTDKEHTHVHAIIRSFNPQTEKQLRILKDDIKNIRKSWAENLQDRGLNYVATLNIDRIKSMTDRLEYIKSKNMSWFEANIEKMKTTNIEELGERLLSTQEGITQLKNRKNEINNELKTIFYNKEKNVLKDNLRTELYHINKNISSKYADLKACITLLNNLEYESQIANINYQKLKENQSKITGVLIKNSHSYKELSQKVDEARELMLNKKLELDQAHIFLSKLNTDKNYNIDLESNKNITYGFKNLDTSIKTFNAIQTEKQILDKSILSQSFLHIEKLSQAINESTTFLNQKTIKNLTNLKTDYLDKNPLPKFNKDIRDIIHKELKSVLNSYKISYYQDKTLTKEDYLKSIREIRTLQQNIRKNYEIPIYKLKKHGIDISKFATKEVFLKTKAIKLNHQDKNIVLNKLNKLQDDKKFTQKFYLKKIIDQVKEHDTIYQSQLNRLKINPTKLFQELSVKEFKNIDIKQDVVNTEKTFVNWHNNDYKHTIKNKNIDYKIELEKLKFTDSKSLDNETLSKLDLIAEKSIKNLDLNSFDIVNKINMSDINLSIKAYGEILQISPKEINLEIWKDIFQEDIKHYKNEYLTAEYNQKMYNYDYKEEFINRYVDKLKSEYTLQKDMPHEAAEEKEFIKYFDKLTDFNKLTDKFKEDYFKNIEKENLTKDIINKLDDGQFLAANKLIDKLDDFDKLFIESYYDYAINDYANNLDEIKNKIDFNSSIIEKSYFIDPDNYQDKPQTKIYKNEELKPKEKISIVLSEEKENLHQDKPQEDINIVNTKPKEKEKLNYDELVKNENLLIKDLVKNIDLSLVDHNKKEKEKLNSINLSNKDKIISAAKNITYALNSNLKEIKDTNSYLLNVQHERFNDKFKDTLHDNLEKFKDIGIDLNLNLNQFITNVNNSKLPKNEKLEVTKTIYDKLDEINYNKEIKHFIKDSSLEDLIINRKINQFKDLTQEIKLNSNPKELNNLAAKSKSMVNNFKESNLSFMNQLKVRTIENKQKSIFRNMNRGLER